MIAPAPVASPCAAQDALQFRAHAQPAGEIWRLSDIADLSRLPPPLRARAAHIPLPWDSRRPATIARSTLSSVVRAHMPMLACWLPRNVGGTVTLGAFRPRQQAQIRPLPDQLDSADGVSPGDTLALTIGIGAVRLERRVEVMQPAKAGQRLFVRDGDGHLLSVRYAGPRP